ncbi:hypothetical protein COR50_17780 [Chitinophaga caeni]|uniref:Uncharacterized protein n=1 Tax=Chitinophaga caeni TaxID=2029983 RepID=A0A291QY21_9BACT|nr:peptidoglycan-binding domain-containing protein [Chitinophaga caeni]ATL48866.1 hypothetical protein COR50_17780 [Chitinophaga caeni]
MRQQSPVVAPKPHAGSSPTTQKKSHFFGSSKEAGTPFFNASSKIAHNLATPPDKDDRSLKQHELAVPYPNPTAAPRELTDAEIADAINYNTGRITDPDQVMLIRDVLGLSHDAPSIDEELIRAVADWQAKYNLVVDGKIGPKTSATLGFEVLQESNLVPTLRPEAIALLEKGIELRVSNNVYTDTAVQSTKDIRFTVFVPRGLRRDDYVLVNWVRGHMRSGPATFFQVRMYGNLVDANFPNFQVDSVDADPIYWSTAASRQNFNIDNARQFHATDSPGPALNTEHGADYDLHFRMGVYRLADVPAATTGNLGRARAIVSRYWSYRVRVSAAGTFSH